MDSIYQSVKQKLCILESSIDSEDSKEMGFSYTQEHKLDYVIEGELYLTKAPIGKTGVSQIVVFLNKHQRKVNGDSRCPGIVVYAPPIKHRRQASTSYLEKSYIAKANFVPLTSIMYKDEYIVPKEYKLAIVESDIKGTLEVESNKLSNYILPKLEVNTERAFQSSIIEFMVDAKKFKPLTIELEYFRNPRIKDEFDIIDAVNRKFEVHNPELSLRGDVLVKDFGEDFAEALTSCVLSEVVGYGLVQPKNILAYLHKLVNTATLISLLEIYEEGKLCFINAFNRAFEGIKFNKYGLKLINEVTNNDFV